jgi:hypothetical protein
MAVENHIAAGVGVAMSALVGVLRQRKFRRLSQEILSRRTVSAGITAEALTRVDFPLNQPSREFAGSNQDMMDIKEDK